MEKSFSVVAVRGVEKNWSIMIEWVINFPECLKIDCIGARDKDFSDGCIMHLISMIRELSLVDQ